ncbi:MAG TPA: transcriptional repressor [Ilumatobacteraceae bacterium]|nr:transcriptional repressor [Ilumatobacteraceae bacterium]
MRPPAELTEAFRRQNLKVTPQRQLLFRLLHGNAAHPSADVLFAEASALMPGISLRTVYQTLNDLAEMGELQHVSVGSGPSRFDPNTDDHHHAVCDRCGDVFDVYVDNLAALQVDGLNGFAPSTVRLVFSGTCQHCATLSLPTPDHVPHDKEQST